MQIEHNSRASFYLQHRAAFPAVTARVAWTRAGLQVAQYEAAKEAYHAAKQELESYWQSLNKKEPKRYAPEGEKLAVLRAALRRASDLSSRNSSYKTQPGRPYPEPTRGLRPVGRAHTDGNRFSDDSGWFTDPWGHYSRDGSGLMWGVVYQLPTRKGEARFIVGYEQGDCDGGPWLDLSTVYTVPAYESDSVELAIDSGACNAANELARINAEKERDYQTAWQAGSQYEQEAESIQEARKAALELLAERRAHKCNGTDSPAICRAIADTVTGWRRDIRKARERMAALADGELSERDGLYWDTTDADSRDAFNEGACL